jgi:hypothetical protein
VCAGARTTHPQERRRSRVHSHRCWKWWGGVSCEIFLLASIFSMNELRERKQMVKTNLSPGHWSRSSAFLEVLEEYREKRAFEIIV